MRIQIVLMMLAICIGCKTKSYDASQPPEGYSNNTTLKIAYASGAIQKTMTDLELPENIRLHKDLVYKSTDSIDLKLDIYRPKNLIRNTPLIVFIHGGAWEKGKKDNLRHYLIPYAQMGYVTATIEYRLSTVAKFPAQLLDVEDAVKWLKTNAEKYWIDNTKVALAGGSAGGHLAMLEAYRNSKLGTGSKEVSAEVQAVVNIYGPSDLTTEIAINEGRVHRLIGKSYKEAPELYGQASPIYYISEKSPPTITFHGTLDELVPYKQSQILHKKLNEAGVPSYYHELKGWPHAMDLSAKIYEYIRYHTDIFFSKHLPLPV